MTTVALAIALAAAVGVSAQTDRPISALETALVDRACDVLVMSRTIPPTDHGKCVDEQLAALRADLGANLGRLSAGERQKLDAACRHLEGAVTRDAYLDCVGAQLAPVRERLRRARPAAAEPVVPAGDVVAAPLAPAAPPARPPSRWLALAVAGGSIAMLAAAAGAVVALKRRRPAAHVVCGSCGAPVATAGALCADCRRQAADALRRAAAERAAEEQEAVRRQQDAAEAAAERERLQQEQARQTALAEEARRREAEEAARQRDVAARQAHAAESPEAGAEPAFDPHAVLGVAKDATPEAIRAAYDDAVAKYDPANVSHLSPEVQQHYRDRAEAVERAFRMLS
ncbi:MAG TPA: hypothetical protein VFB07_04780 [Vicinamibacterales bacterium]|nr:hypothetical protein [Vicinamibacterales bacterium]